MTSQPPPTNAVATAAITNNTPASPTMVLLKKTECMLHCLPAASPVHECVQDQFVANEMAAGLEELDEESNISVVAV